MVPELGIIEGYFGRPWTFAARQDVAALLAPHGFSFFLYAPKAEAFLRRRWRDPFPPEAAAELRQFAAFCRSLGVKFGMGLTPFEAHAGFDAEARNCLAAKVCQLAQIGMDDLAILFDDMRGDFPDLAKRQAEIVACAAEASSGVRIIVCPTYYSDDAVLDRVFGQRPANYLSELGALLDPSVDVFWTGAEVCAREFNPGHLERVSDTLGRKPMLWDNYPVNDGPRMSRFLHLRGFTGRPSGIAEHIAAHAINPSLQPRLTCIPALTLAASYRKGDRYDYMEAFRGAAARVAGEEIAGMLEADLLLLEDAGLDRLGERAPKLRARWSSVDHPIAAEIVAWLDGAYAVGAGELETQ